MYGFTIIKTDSNLEESFFKFKSKLSFDSENNTRYFFGYNFFDKFKEDKLFEERDNYIIGLDGVLLNLQNLKNSFGISDYFDLIIHLFKKSNINFLDELKGEFSGFIYNKDNNELNYFNNKKGTKQVFYSQFSQTTIISSSIDTILKLRNHKSVSNYLNKESVYNMLTFGANIKNTTLIEDVFSISAGKYLQVVSNKLLEKEYHSFSNLNYDIKDSKKAIHLINEAFEDAVKLQHEKDLEYNFNHFALLSGGLDSRVNVLSALKQGYKSEVLCFSKQNYLDEKISRQIAKEYNLKYNFISLKNGIYMNAIDKNVTLNNGSSIFTGSAHYNFALEKHDISNYGLVHTGQIGDGILGGLVSNNKNQDFFLKVKSRLFLDRLGLLDSYLKSYKSEEIFTLYHSVFTVANSGSYTTESYKTYLVSPFLDEDLMDVALSIHPDLKYNQDFYIDWIVNKQKEATKFIWERTGFKPNKKWKTALSIYTNKLKKEFFLLMNREGDLSMAPEDYWLKTNSKVKVFYANFFEEKISYINNDLKLKEDLVNYYKVSFSNGKATVLTILQMISKYNLKV